VADICFEYTFAPRKPSEHVARKAIITQLVPRFSLKPAKAGDDYWSTALGRILGLWRGRASDLCNLGASHFALRQMQRLRNCHPWGVSVKHCDKPVVYCRHLDICPWCIGRKISELYVKVCNVLEPNDALVSVLGANFFPDDMGYDEMRLELEAAADIMRSIGRGHSDRSRAVAWSVVMDPPTKVRQKRADFFCIRSRLLMVLPAAKRNFPLPFGQGWRSSRINQPTEKDCQNIVRAVSTYPVGLLLGDPRHVLLFLAARDGLRLAEQSGAFRSHEGFYAARDKDNENIVPFSQHVKFENSRTQEGA
jgi:hypothetical protein